MIFEHPETGLRIGVVVCETTLDYTRNDDGRVMSAVLYKEFVTECGQRCEVSVIDHDGDVQEIIVFVSNGSAVRLARVMP